jgi:hypothetical protein
MNSVGKAGESIEDMIQILGSGSDHSIFSFYAGVPSIYFRFQPDTHKYPGEIFTENPSIIMTQATCSYKSNILLCPEVGNQTFF